MPFYKFLDPKNDYAFKCIFGTEKNQDILIHFINDIVPFPKDKQIQTVKFLKPNQNPEISSKKQSILDVLCTDEHGRQYIVEMQVVKTRGFEKRAQYYAAKAYSNQLNQGEHYDQLKEIIFVAITDFVMFPDKKEYKSDHVMLDKVTHAHDLKDFYFVFLELPKFNKTMGELNTMVEKWAYFFKHAEETNEKDLSKIAGSDVVIERAYEALNRFSWSESQLFTYEHEEKVDRDNVAALAYALDEAQAKGMAKGIAKGMARGMKKGIEEGIEKGIEKGMAKGIEKGVAKGKMEEKIIIAKQMHANNIDITTIANCTQLSETKVREILSSGKS